MQQIRTYVIIGLRGVGSILGTTFLPSIYVQGDAAETSQAENKNTPSIPASLSGWIRDHLQHYLDSDGADGHMWDSSSIGGPGPVPTLLLTTTSRRSGQRQILPLIYGEFDGKYVVIASKGGAPKHPGWYRNLVAQPEVGVQVIAERFQAKARTATGEERTVLWKKMAVIYPPYNDYQARTEREIPVVVLERE
jgi:proline iminopeptidase